MRSPDGVRIELTGVVGKLLRVGEKNLHMLGDKKCEKRSVLCEQERRHTAKRNKRTGRTKVFSTQDEI